MELRKINAEDAYAQWQYTTKLPKDENGLTNDFFGVSFEEYKETVLSKIISYEHPVNMPDWFVPEDEIYLRLLKSNVAKSKSDRNCIKIGKCKLICYTMHMMISMKKRVMVIE